MCRIGIQQYSSVCCMQLMWSTPTISALRFPAKILLFTVLPSFTLHLHHLLHDAHLVCVCLHCRYLVWESSKFVWTNLSTNSIVMRPVCVVTTTPPISPTTDKPALKSVKHIFVFVLKITRQTSTPTQLVCMERRRSIL